MLDSVPLLHISVCVIAGILLTLFSFLRRPAGVLALTLIGIVAIYRNSVVGFLLTNGIVYAVSIWLARGGSERGANSKVRWVRACIAMLVLIAVFLIGRWLQLESRGVTIAGIHWTLFNLDMWLVLRLVTFLWEVGSGRIQQPLFKTFAVWVAMPFILHGPVFRYSQFETQLPWSLSPPKRGDLGSKPWVLKLLVATLQIGAGGALIKLHSSLFAGGTESLSLWTKLIDGFGISPWSFLLLWGGYYKLMECLALMWGIVLPRSFNMPFGRANISEFWANWNMSATSVFRDYLFYIRWGQRKPNLYLNTFIIFILVGLWHGTNWYWLIFGLMHGAGFCCFMWYRKQQNLKRFEIKGIPYQLFGRPITYLFVCSCWIVPSRILKLLGLV
jgi:D-alanyl-lipoteichoic acid acyltransferase DltB (MBOAT superfamily)